MLFARPRVAVSFFDGFCYFHAKHLAEPLRIPAVAAFEAGSDRVIALGDDAARMAGHEPPNIVVRRGLARGLPADLATASTVLCQGFRTLFPRSIFMPRPTTILALRPVAYRKFVAKDTLMTMGAQELYLIENGMAAAIGMGLPVQETALQAVLTVSDDWFDFSLISLGGIVARVDGDLGLDDFARDICAHVRLARGFLPDHAGILRALFTSGVRGTEKHACDGWEAWLGRSGLGARTHGELDGETLAIGLAPSLLRIVEAIRGVLENLGRERTEAWQSATIHCCGAAFQVAGVAELFSQHLGLRCEKTPIEAPAILGASRALAELRFLRKVTRVGAS